MGLRDTYDLEMISKPHNFVLNNGLITHNSFNKSHSVAYGLVSYFCAYLKAHWPLEFAAATLRHAKDEAQTITVLRELTEEGYPYVPFDARLSRENWEVFDGQLVGGFLNLRGVGETTAKELVAARDEGWTPKQIDKIVEAEVLYHDIFRICTLSLRLTAFRASTNYGRRAK